MKQILFLILVSLAMSSQLVRSAGTPTLIERPRSGNAPTQVSVAIWIVDLSNIDSAQQSFTADLAIVLRWKDARLAHAGPGLTQYALDQIWTPSVAIANETSSVVRKLPESAEVEPDGTVLYRQRYVGSFTQGLHLQSFPFDRQAFRIQFVAIRYQPNEVVFVPDENWIHEGLQQAGGISRSITLPDWTVERWSAKRDVYALTPNLQYSGYVFEFTASRNAQHYVWNVILPLVLIVGMSWSVFWIAATEVGPQLSVATTSMLTLIAYRFAIDNQLPALPYTTSLDTFILMSTLLVFCAFIEVLVTTILDGKHLTKLSKQIDCFSRIIFPGVFLVASIVIFVRSRG